MKFQAPEQMDQENKELEALEQAEADTSANADAGPHFEPIIPLPDLVEVNKSFNYQIQKSWGPAELSFMFVSFIIAY